MFQQIHTNGDSIYRQQAIVFPLLGLLSYGFLQFYSGAIDDTLWERFKSSFGQDAPPAETPGNRPLQRLSKRARHAARRRGPAGDKVAGSAAPLPRLQPLNCHTCGAGVLLGETETRCPSCGRRAPVPEDHRIVARLKSQIARAFQRAARHWKLARLLFRPFVGRILLGLTLLQLGVLIVSFLGYVRYGSAPDFHAHAARY